MFGTSGIRGPVGEEVTAELPLRVGCDADRVVVGRDPRESGEALLDALAAGLCETGRTCSTSGSPRRRPSPGQ